MGHTGRSRSGTPETHRERRRAPGQTETPGSSSRTCWFSCEPGTSRSHTRSPRDTPAPATKPTASGPPIKASRHTVLPTPGPSAHAAELLPVLGRRVHRGPGHGPGPSALGGTSRRARCNVTSVRLSDDATSGPLTPLSARPGRGGAGAARGGPGGAGAQALRMSDGILSKAATMEIPISSNGDTSSLPEDDGLEQDLQQVMVSGPNLNETSIVSGGYGGTAEGIIPTGTIKAPPFPGSLVHPHPPRGPSVPPSAPAARRMARPAAAPAGPGLHPPPPGPPPGGEEVVRGIAVEKFDIVKKWGINTYKCTKQLLSERFGRGSRTVDLELETQIELLRETKRKYESVLHLARALTAHLYSLVQTQHALGDAFADLSQKSPELQEEFGYNAETQKLLCKNGETLLGAVNFFVSSINTLVNKTMEDTLMTVKQYETARLEYDAYRTDLEELSMGPRDAGAVSRLDAAQSQFQSHKDKYEKLRADVAIKLKFLEENKIKVMHKQLLLFHNAISAYFAGNQQQLEQTLKQFNIKLKTPGAEKPSWLEEQ